MGRSGGCCNFQHSANCTAPPCPSGSCCYVTEAITNQSLTELHEVYKCEDGVTENCCLAKPFSMFNEEAECGEQKSCSDVVIPEIYNTDKAFILLKPDGTVAAWGDPDYGGEIPSRLEPFLVNIKDIYTTSKSVVAVSVDGNAYGWGDMDDASLQSGFNVPVTLDAHQQVESLNNNFTFVQWVTDVKSITTSRGAFAAITTGGEVKVWGDYEFGGSSGFADLRPLQIVAEGKTIVEIAATDTRFAALDKDGTVYLFGGGNVYDRRDVNKDGLVDVVDFREIKFDYIAGRLTAPFHSAYDTNRDGIVNTDDYDFDYDQNKNGHEQLSRRNPNYESGFTSVKKMYANKHSFAFLKHDGTVLVWGDHKRGGNTGVNHELLTGVKEIYTTDEAFLALREDGKIVVWGFIQSDASPSSTFYDVVREVHPSRSCFGIVYDKDNRSYFDVVGTFFTHGVTQSEPDIMYHTTEAEVCEEVNFGREGCKDAVTTSLPILLGNDIEDKYPWSSTPRSENLEHHFIFASNWAFYIMDAYTSSANFFLRRDGSRFYVVGADASSSFFPNRKAPTGHSTKLDYDVLNPRYLKGRGFFKNGNRNKEDRPLSNRNPDDECVQLDDARLDCNGSTVNNGGRSGKDNSICPDDSYRWHNRPAGYVPHLQRDIESCVKSSRLIAGGDPNDKIRKFTRTQNVFAFTERASSFITENMNQFSLNAFSFGPYIHSMGHINYGGWGGSEADFTSSTYPNSRVEGPLSRNGNFYGIFSNNHAFCAVMAFVEDEQGNLANLDEFPSRVKFLIKTWGDQRYGGKSPFDPIRPNMGYLCGEEFRSESFGEVISQLTFEGCHPDHCNQDIK